MNEPSQPQEVQELPASLKWLRSLVFALTVIMIGGLITVVAVFVTRFPTPGQISLPETITLPDGAVATAFTLGDGWYAVVTLDNDILVFDAASGALLQRIEIAAPN